MTRLGSEPKRDTMLASEDKMFMVSDKRIEKRNNDKRKNDKRVKTDPMMLDKRNNDKRKNDKRVKTDPMMLDKRNDKRKKRVKSGPLKSKEGIPYDYIIVIDSGSKGSRVFVYNWLSPYHALKQGYDLTQHSQTLSLIDAFASRDDQADDDSDSDDDDIKKPNKSHHSNKDRPESDLGNDKHATVKEIKLPKVHMGKKWHRKINPGLSSFSSSPQKVGNRHIKNLLSLASAVVPRSQHSRTPIFLHSTAGMRLLPPDEQSFILSNVCAYIQSNSDFYIPDCSSHINVIDGDIEGLYGWLSINYLMNTFDRPEEHQHGKNHTTYGLLDMGGASTQVVFQPNSTEIQEHTNNLYQISLSRLPTLKPDAQDTTNSPPIIGNYTVPATEAFHVYSDSFLGFGMSQAHNRYLTFLTDKYRQDNKVEDNGWGFYGGFSTPVPDPCLPKGYTTSSKIHDENVDFVGESNFDKCLQSIFPVLTNTTHSAGTSGYKGNGQCKQFNEGDEVSSCLLNDLIPSFDFDVNHFIGVSGYWDALTHLLSYESKIPRMLSSRDDTTNHSPDESYNRPDSDNETESKGSDTYDYTVIYQETSKLCSQSLSQLFELNNVRPKKQQMKEDELSELCFKSSWILNFLHLGLGFPRFGIDKVPNKNDRFKSLQLAEKVGGSTFSWTLGRALLYANDEYVQAFNNYTLELSKKDQSLVKRPGYFYTAVDSVFHYGAEQSGVSPRPQFIEPDPNAKYTHYGYESDTSGGDLSKWYIEPHRWYGITVLLSLFCLIIWLMLGARGRKAALSNTYMQANRTLNRLRQWVSQATHAVRGDSMNTNGRYTRVTTSASGERDLEVAGFELNDLGSGESDNHKSSTEDDSRVFKVDSDEDTS